MVPVKYIYDSLIINMLNKMIMNGHIKRPYPSITAPQFIPDCFIIDKSNQYFLLDFQPTFHKVITPKQLSVKQQSAMEHPK